MIGAGFAAFRSSRLNGVLARVFRGYGVVLTLHRVRPWRPKTPGYAPNALLEITPDFLDRALAKVVALGFEIVALDEVPRRLGVRGGRGAPFAALTFDDGYVDFRDYALPVLERHGAPATLFLCPGMIESGAQLWWLQLEEAIRRLDFIELAGEGTARRWNAETPLEKAVAYDEIYWRLRARPEAELLAVVQSLAERAGVTDAEMRDGLFLDWSALEALSRHPLIAIGAHSLTHRRLALWPEPVAREEMAGSKGALEAQLKLPAKTLAYPVGDAQSAASREFALARACGFELAVTTRPGMLFPEHVEHLHALPRVSLNGLYQDERHLEALLTGAPFALWNRGRRLNVG